TPVNRPPRLWPVRDRPRRRRPSQEPEAAGPGACASAERSSRASGSEDSSGRSDQASGGCTKDSTASESDPASGAGSVAGAGSRAPGAEPSACAAQVSGSSVGATGATSGASADSGIPAWTAADSWGAGAFLRLKKLNIGFTLKTIRPRPGTDQRTAHEKTPDSYCRRCLPPHAHFRSGKRALAPDARPGARDPVQLAGAFLGWRLYRPPGAG